MWPTRRRLGARRARLAVASGRGPRARPPGRGVDGRRHRAARDRRLDPRHHRHARLRTRAGGSGHPDLRDRRSRLLGSPPGTRSGRLPARARQPARSGSAVPVAGLAAGRRVARLAGAGRRDGPVGRTGTGVGARETAACRAGARGSRAGGRFASWFARRAPRGRAQRARGADRAALRRPATT